MTPRSSSLRRLACLAVLGALFAPSWSCWPPRIQNPPPYDRTKPAKNTSALIVYNENEADALEVADYYIDKRNIAPQYKCPVRLPRGLYASTAQLLSARDQIVENCLCPLIPATSRPSPCDPSTIDQIINESMITHLVLIKGIPARLTDTPWPTGTQEPSFDFYLSYLVYNDEDIFGPGSRGAVNSLPAAELGEHSYRALRPDDRFLAYGRVEAITFERTKDLIARTLAAEAEGFEGALLSETPLIHGTMSRLGGDDTTVCDGYLTHTPFIPLSTESTWDSESCRAGTTGTHAVPGSSPGVVPGNAQSSVPYAMHAGLFLGGDATANPQAGFQSFWNMLRWHKATETCTELCEDLPTTQEQDDCRAASSDYFKEINTGCVGGALGFMGHQARSYPVTHYGFFPPGWWPPPTGVVEHQPVEVRDGDGYTDAIFTDTTYAHWGRAAVGQPDPSMCEDAQGALQLCKEPVPLFLRAAITGFAPIPVTSTRPFEVRLRYRQPAIAASLRLALRCYNGTDSYEVEQAVPLQNVSSWTPLQTTIVADSALHPFANQITRIDLTIQATLSDGTEEFVDIDAVEVVDTLTGIQMLDQERSSFDVSNRHHVGLGQMAANAIDRLGAVAWWGSSSHHLTDGWAFLYQDDFIRALASGRTLGESLVYAKRMESGIIYGDPLYQPMAAKLFLKLSADLDDDPALLGTSPIAVPIHRVDDHPLFAHALLGHAFQGSLQWEVHSCAHSTREECDAQDAWTARQSGSKAQKARKLWWGNWLATPDSLQPLVVRLKVFRPAEPERALYSYAHLQTVLGQTARLTNLAGEDFVGVTEVTPANLAQHDTFLMTAELAPRTADTHWELSRCVFTDVMDCDSLLEGVGAITDQPHTWTTGLILVDDAYYVHTLWVSPLPADQSGGIPPSEQPGAETAVAAFHFSE